MDRILVVVFETEEQAREGLRVLRQLDRDGSMAVYDAAIVAKHANGTTPAKQGGEFDPLELRESLDVAELLGDPGLLN